jgi:circadian clock protein KaiB
VSASTPGLDGPTAPLSVRLYVAGDSPNSTRAAANLRALMVELALPPEAVELVDVLRDPERGLSDGVLVTPMLVRVAPLPQRRILGNLSDRALLLGVLSPQGAARE